MNQYVGFIAELSTYASSGSVVGTTLTNRRPSLHPFFLFRCSRIASWRIY